MKTAIAIVVTASLLLSACARPMEICGVTYQSYGLIDADNKKNPDIEYEVIWGNIFWGAVLFETVIAPIYFFGFSLFNPVGKKSPIKGSVDRKPTACEAKP